MLMNFVGKPRFPTLQIQFHHCPCSHLFTLNSWKVSVAGETIVQSNKTVLPPPEGKIHQQIFKKMIFCQNCCILKSNAIFHIFSRKNSLPDLTNSIPSLPLLSSFHAQLLERSCRRGNYFPVQQNDALATGSPILTESGELLETNEISLFSTTSSC